MSEVNRPSVEETRPLMLWILKIILTKLRAERVGDILENARAGTRYEAAGQLADGQGAQRGGCTHSVDLWQAAGIWMASALPKNLVKRHILSTFRRQ